MQEMSVYIVNLGKYVEGKSVGAWFSLPVNEEAVRERIGLNEHYEEYAVHDYELPFDVDEYISISELNKEYEMFMELDEDIRDGAEALLKYYTNLKELYEHEEEIEFYADMDTLDLAYYLIDECQVLGEIPDRLRFYIDYCAYERDFCIENTVVEANGGVYVLR